MSFLSGQEAQGIEQAVAYVSEGKVDVNGEFGRKKVS